MPKGKLITADVITKIYSLKEKNVTNSLIAELLDVSDTTIKRYSNALDAVKRGDTIDTIWLSAEELTKACELVGLPEPRFGSAEQEEAPAPATPTITDTDVTSQEILNMLKELREQLSSARQNIALTRSAVRALLEVQLRMLAVWSPDAETAVRTQIINGLPIPVTTNKGDEHGKD